MSERGSKNKRWHLAFIQLKLWGRLGGIMTVLSLLYVERLVVILNDPSVQYTISIA
jgi:hypothetical protein